MMSRIHTLCPGVISFVLLAAIGGAACVKGRSGSDASAGDGAAPVASARPGLPPPPDVAAPP